MACIGPFKYGVAANPYCGCTCETLCCPPPCCTEITEYYQIGYCPPSVGISDKPKEWVSKVVGKYIVPFPTFELPEPRKATEKDFVFQAGNSCTIPCEIVTITISTSGCCIEKIGATLRAVGDGFVQTVVSASPCDITVLINGEAGPVAAVNDGDMIVIQVQVDSPACCTATQYDTVCTPFNFSSASLFYRTMSLGRGFAYLNVRKLADKVRRLKRRGR